MDKQLQEFVIEHEIFHMLVKKFKRPDVRRVYLAIQAAIAYEKEAVDVGWLMGRMMDEGRGTFDVYCDNIGPAGLAFFHFLYEVELVDAGSTNYHQYRFTRRYDHATILAELKTAMNPESATFRSDYEKQIRKLEKARNAIFEKYRWATTEELFTHVFGDGKM